MIAFAYPSCGRKSCAWEEPSGTCPPAEGPSTNAFLR
jgi:hypothetical protein